MGQFRNQRLLSRKTADLHDGEAEDVTVLIHAFHHRVVRRIPCHNLAMNDVLNVVT
jgi:hypothetical protein